MSGSFPESGAKFCTLWVFVGGGRCQVSSQHLDTRGRTERVRPGVWGPCLCSLHAGRNTGGSGVGMADSPLQARWEWPGASCHSAAVLGVGQGWPLGAEMWASLGRVPGVPNPCTSWEGLRLCPWASM